MRIGVHLTGREARAVLADGSRVHACGAAMGGRALGTVLRELAGQATYSVRSVTLEVSDLLVDAVCRTGAGSAGAPVSVLRVLPRTSRHTASADHPSAMMRSFVAHRAAVSGGHDLFGTALAPLDVSGAVAAALEAHRSGLRAMAVVATGAVGAPGHESAVARAVLDAVPELRLSLSHEVGGVGLLLRESAAVLNAVMLSAAGDLVDRCRRAVRRLGDVSCWFATADGGRISAERLRALPVLGLDAAAAMNLLGAAALHGRGTGTVVVDDGRSCTIGELRDGLPHVAADLHSALGVRLAAPRPVVDVVGTEEFRADPARWLRGAPHEVPVIATEGRPDLGALGAALCEPTAWVDLVVQAESADELCRQRRAVEERALRMVVTSEAPPGSERIVESGATALAYMRAGTYRVRARATTGARA
ncbi:hypothetical protein ACFYWS_25065 [Streptomyces sp. NPDC002795]|uniref:hypothetical protein n=1 Tax=Streptomyces sp. NPDC002795 TaxID=3364665 RepID=UPI0036AB72F0